jgi:tetratricopeptide (TPR) repeat protein/predicted membrane-bound spermidine synthase
MTQPTTRRGDVAKAPQPACRSGLVLANLTVFVASLCIMVAELVAGRIISRYLGVSLYTWTSCIGVFLTGLSVGNYLGGRLADRYPARPALSVLFILASLMCLLVPILNQAMGEWSWLWEKQWPVRIFIHVTATFVLPATMLGVIAPVAAKMALDEGRSTGRTIGQVYAWGAVGSIFGTYLTGFYLIAHIGTTVTIVGVSVLLAVMGVLYGGRSWWPRFTLAAALAGGVVTLAGGGPLQSIAFALHLRERPHEDVIWEDESAYSHIWVTRLDGDPNLRALTLDRLTHSVLDVRDLSDMKYDYCRVYQGVVETGTPAGTPVTALFLGGGGYVFPRYLEMTRSNSWIDVVEIDPRVTDAARAGCGFREDSRIQVHHLDARQFVSDRLRPTARGVFPPAYDYIFGDTFNDASIPFHLTTVEFQQQIRDQLRPGGVYLLNCIDVVERGRLLASIIATCRAVFPHVQVFSCSGMTSYRSTFVLACSREPRELSAASDWIRNKYAFPGRRWTAEEVDDFCAKTGGLVLTDRFAPVENMLAGVIQGDPGRAASEYLERGARAARAGRSKQAAASFQRVLDMDSRNARALYNLGLLNLQQGDSRKALEFLVQAWQVQPDLALSRDLVGTILTREGRWDDAIEWWTGVMASGAGAYAAQLNLGEIYYQQGQFDQARRHWQAAVRMEPGDPALHFKLGQTCAVLGDAGAAERHYRTALSGRPDFAEAYNNLGVLMIQQGRAEQARELFASAVRYNPDLQSARDNLRRVESERPTP